MEMLGKLIIWLASDQAGKIIMPTAIAFVIVALAVDYRKKHKKKPTGFRQAQKGKGHGMIVGLINGKEVFVPESEDWHAVVMGGTGDGKTSGIAVPVLQSWKGKGLCIDISGDMSSKVEHPYKAVYRPLKGDTPSYNVFAPADAQTSEIGQNEELEALAYLLREEPPNMDDNARYFLQGGRRILKSALIAFYHEGMDFAQICRKITTSGYQQLFREIDNTGNEEAISLINVFVGGNERNISGCYEQCVEAVEVFAKDTLKDALRRPRHGEAGFSSMSVEDSLLFVEIPDPELEKYSPLLHLITGQVLQYISNRPERNREPVLIMLDEFVSLSKGGKLDITPSLRKSRKHNCHIVILTQSVNDIDLYYGETERKSMMNNFSIKVIMSAQDPETQKWVSDLVGNRIITRKSTAKNSKITTRTKSEEKDVIIEPSDIGRLDDAALVLNKKGYLLVKRNYAFANPLRNYGYMPRRK